MVLRVFEAAIFAALRRHTLDEAIAWDCQTRVFFSNGTLTCCSQAGSGACGSVYYGEYKDKASQQKVSIVQTDYIKCLALTAATNRYICLCMD
jgi:hypothetical protein